MRSSWRCSLSSSPETRVPPSRLRLRRRVSRSRSRSSWSVAIRGKEPQESRDVRLQLWPGDDRVDVAEAKVLLRKSEILRQLLAGCLLHDARAGKGEQSTGLGDDHIAQAGEASQHAGGGRMCHHADKRLAGIVEV